MKIGIVTIIDDNNYGNRLQNYALQEYLTKEISCKKITTINNKFSFLFEIIQKIKKTKNYIVSPKKRNRYKNFGLFNKNINFSKIIYFKNSNFKKLNKYNYLVVGSDQVWNPTFNRLTNKELLSNILPSKRISYAASFGINDLPKQHHLLTQKELQKFKAISVREDRGKEIVEELTGRKDIEVLIDPTMLLTAEEWDKVSKKPKMLNTDKYILNYFLGTLSENRKKEINRIAKENNCEIINILDKNSPFYECGPSEFLWLEKNAFLICTDSFHSSVFAILYNRPFIIFDREQKGIVNMNSRLETLISKFKLKNRKFEGKITEKNLNPDYSETYKILEKERKKSKEFLEKVLEIKEGDYCE